MKKSKARDLIGCCGLYCGLCTKYQSKAPSRCIGCQLGEQHSWCSIWNCCVKKHGFTTCAECGDVFGCALFQRRRVADWIPAAQNLRQILKAGLESVLDEQEDRRGLLEELLQHYNEGRSMSLYCKACARMPVPLIAGALEETKESIKGAKGDRPDVKSKAMLMKAAIQDLASKASIDLK
jgi:hypothetical protein